MADTALASIYRAIKTRLTESPSELWSARIYPDLAPPNVTRPYVIYTWLGGGELNDVKSLDAELVIGIKCVAETLATAFTGAARVAALLNDADIASAIALDGGALFDIINVTQEGAIHLVETIDGKQIYHHGGRYRFRLEQP